jgi:hypothetical protein
VKCEAILQELFVDVRQLARGLSPSLRRWSLGMAIFSLRRVKKPAPNEANQMTKLMTVAEAAAKEKTAYTADSGSGVVYVLDHSMMTDTPDESGSYGAFVAMRREAGGGWEFAPELTEGLLEADYQLILDYEEAEALVTEARTSLSVSPVRAL